MRAGDTARIGPNAILQLVPVLDACVGAAARQRLFLDAGVAELPDGRDMIDEAPVARLHQALRRDLPDIAPAVAASAGTATGDYVIANRIPAFARTLLRLLPAGLAARALSRAITRHAWTFAGSGTFRVASLKPLVFEITGNPIVRGERAERPVCDWHAAVFERLFRRLVADDYRVVETTCAAAAGAVCRFDVHRNVAKTVLR